MSVSEEATNEQPDPAPDGPINEGAPNYSNAQNFLSHLQTGVDVRTGDFTCAMSLPALEANRLQGPTVQLGLGFSSQLRDDLGYGEGWALTGLTTYEPTSKIVVLSTGERFVADQASSEFTFKDRKLVTFHMRREANGYDYVVTHKNGVIERLSTLNGVARTAVPVEIRSPDGRCVFLQFTRAQAPQLVSVSDETGLLLSIERKSAAVTVTLHPEGEQPVVFSLLQVGGTLSRLRLPPALCDVGWTFIYKTIAGLKHVTRVELPTGGVETVDYSEPGHQCLPGAPTTHVPYVRLHTRTPGHPQPAIVTSYSYSPRNYMGHLSGLQWRPNQDNLYLMTAQVGKDYRYDCTATMQMTVDGVTLERTVTSEFNRLHLLVSEVTTQNKCVLEKITRYHDDPTESFADQVPYFQLPHETITRWSRSEEGSPVREEKVTTEYDDYGNLIRQVDETGLIEERTYYKAEGEEGCPPDPLQMVRSLKELTAIPMAGRAEGAATVVTRYRYDTLPSRVEGDDGYLVLLNEQKVALVDGEEVDLGTSSTEYIDDVASDAHGRVPDTAPGRHR